MSGYPVQTDNTISCPQAAVSQSHRSAHVFTLGGHCTMQGESVWGRIPIPYFARGSYTTFWGV